MAYLCDPDYRSIFSEIVFQFLHCSKHVGPIVGRLHVVVLGYVLRASDLHMQGARAVT